MNVWIVLSSYITESVMNTLSITLCSSCLRSLSSLCLSLFVIRYSSSNRQKCEHLYLGKRISIRGLLEVIFAGCSDRVHVYLYVGLTKVRQK